MFTSVIRPLVDAFIQWSRDGGANNNDRIRESVANDDTYISTNAADTGDVYISTALDAPPSAIITAVRVKARVRDMAHDTTVRLKLLVIDASTLTADIAVPTSFDYISATWTTNPVQARQWRVSDFVNFPIGLYCPSGTSINVRCSQMYCEVEWQKSSDSFDGMGRSATGEGFF